MMSGYDLSVPILIPGEKPYVINCTPEDTYYLRFLLNQISYNYSLDDEYTYLSIRSNLFEILAFIMRKNKGSITNFVGWWVPDISLPTNIE